MSQAEVTAIAVSFDHQVSEGRILRFHTGIAEDAPAEAIDRLLDKLTAAADRQAAKYRLEELRRKIAAEEKIYASRSEDLIRIDAEAQAEYEKGNRRQPWAMERMSPAKQQERNNVQVFLARARDGILEWRAEEKLLAQKVNGVAHSTADSR